MAQSLYKPQHVFVWVYVDESTGITTQGQEHTLVQPGGSYDNDKLALYRLLGYQRCRADGLLYAEVL
jgi:hypothetical protein